MTNALLRRYACQCNRQRDTREPQPGVTTPLTWFMCMHPKGNGVVVCQMFHKKKCVCAHSPVRMDGLHADVFAHLFHAMGKGFFPFGAECPIDASKASMPLTIIVSPFRGVLYRIPYGELAQRIPFDAHIKEHWTTDWLDDGQREFVHEMREALRTILALAGTCSALHAGLEAWGESLLRHARLAAPLLRPKTAADHVLAQLNVRPLRPEDYLFLLGCIARRAPEDVLAGKHVGPCRKIARSSRARALYLIKRGGGRLRAVAGSALKPDEQPIFKVGGHWREMTTPEIIQRYRQRRAIEEQRKDDNRMLRKRKVEEEAAGGPAKKKRKTETSLVS